MATHTHPSRPADLLVVDDEPDARDALSLLLRQRGYSARVAASGAEALAAIEERVPDLVLTDLSMPEMSGFELLSSLHLKYPSLPVVVVTSTRELEAAVEAMRSGAADYVTKPINEAVLLVALERALENRDVRVEVEHLRAQLREKHDVGLAGLIGTSPAMQRIYRMVKQVATSKATVLLTGESGTGKGDVAHAIHSLGPLHDKPFVSLHCAALAPTLLESELFGHEKGAFTGADRRRIGRFEQADGGTLFLDEVGELPQSVQVKLLRVLQERTFERVGGNQSIRVDVRLIAATNRDLQAEVRAGNFREDLYYRLNVVVIDMPPLRVRTEDILPLAYHFLRLAAEENHKRIEGFTDEARKALLDSRWPGNVRALRNAIDRAVVLSESTLIDARDLPLEDGPQVSGLPRIPGATMRELERHAILTTLAAVGGSTTRAAQLLDIGARTIQYRLQEYGLAREPGAPSHFAQSKTLEALARAQAGGWHSTERRTRGRRAG